MRKRPRDHFVNLIKAYKELKEHHREITKQSSLLEEFDRESLSALHLNQIAEQRKYQEALERAADMCQVFPGELRKAKTLYGSTYASASTSPAYAQSLAWLLACKIKVHGLPVEVRRIEPETVVNPFKSKHLTFFTVAKPADFEVWASVQSDLDLDILHHKSCFAFPDEVRFILASGANPRVIIPFLPHGSEASWGIDNFGRVINRVAFDKACGSITLRLPVGNHEAATWKP